LKLTLTKALAMPANKKYTQHRFLDEAGDISFYGKGKKNIIGTIGVSNCFIIGMVKFRQPLVEIRNSIKELQEQVSDNPYYNVPSVKKKNEGGGYYFHATDDLPEIRKLFFDFIKATHCSFEAVVGRKSVERYETKHKGVEQYFYADLLSHLLKNKLSKNEELVLHIAQRGKSTRNHNLSLALEKAKERFVNTSNLKNLPDNELTEEKKIIKRNEVKGDIVFNVTQPRQEPLLTIADYFCWSVQRVFETGETRFYDYLKEKVSLVIDLYDTSKYAGWNNYYNPKNPLTSENKISPQLH
jgi:Protein of unknown function (DUF3800)